MKTHKAPSKAMTKIVDKFNEQFPVGTRVILRKDSGEIETTVREPAQILSGRSAVAWFQGVFGCYSIEDKRVKVPGGNWL